MKKRTMALLLTAALALSLLGATALAAEGDNAAAPDRPAVQGDVQSGQPAEGDVSLPAEAPEAPEGAEGGEPSEDMPIEEYIPDPVGSISFANLERRMHEGSLQVLALQESIDMLEEIDYDDLKEDLRLQLNQMAQMQWMMVQMGQSGSSLTPSRTAICRRTTETPSAS